MLQYNLLKQQFLILKHPFCVNIENSERLLKKYDDTKSEHGSCSFWCTYIVLTHTKYFSHWNRLDWFIFMWSQICKKNWVDVSWGRFRQSPNITWCVTLLSTFTIFFSKKQRKAVKFLIIWCLPNVYVIDLYNHNWQNWHQKNRGSFNRLSLLPSHHFSLIVSAYSLTLSTLNHFVTIDQKLKLNAKAKKSIIS